MRRVSRAAAAAGIASAALLVTAAGCGDSGSSKAAPTPKPAPETTAAADSSPPVAAATKPKPNGKKVTLHKSDYGRILSDGKGLALYLFTADDDKSRCYGDCAKEWPPLITKGKPQAVGDVKQDLLGTVKRKNGKKQVTYKGNPLYYYVGDDEPGEVLCQAVYEFGGYWYVVKKSGGPVK